MGVDPPGMGAQSKRFGSSQLEFHEFRYGYGVGKLEAPSSNSLNFGLVMGLVNWVANLQYLLSDALLCPHTLSICRVCFT